MIPQQAPVRRLVEFGDAHPVRPGRDVLGDDIHGNLGQVQVRPDAGGGGDAGLTEDIGYDRARQLVRGGAVQAQVPRHVDEHLVDRVDVDVLGRRVFEIDRVDPRALPDIGGHARLGDDIGRFQRGIGAQLAGVAGLVDEPAAGGGQTPALVDLPHLPHDLEQPGAAGQAIRLQGRGHRQADRLLRAADIRHHQMRVQRIDMERRALRRRIERLQVYGYIGTVHGTHLPQVLSNKCSTISGVRVSRAHAIAAGAPGLPGLTKMPASRTGEASMPPQRQRAVEYLPLSNAKPVHCSYSRTIWSQESSMLSVRPNRPERPIT